MPYYCDVIESKKEAGGNKEETKEEKKEEEEEEQQENEEIVLKVDMHCEACARKVAKALKRFEGVVEVKADSKGSRVVVKGKAADPIKVLERLQKKSGKKVELISPLPKPLAPEEEKEENKEPPLEEKKIEEPPAVVTLVLKVRMHCEACAQVIQKRIRKIQGVESVETDLANDQVTVKGVIDDPAKLVDYVYKRTKKQALIVKEEKEEGKKEVEKKEEKEGEGKEEGEEKKGEDEDNNNNKTDEVKRSEYWPSKSYVDYAYAPQIFSDENPNACSLM
ncbi:hypothetical protein RIF29_08263 [Crotalaria pallida]|uniref:HMA domain-containing protein n=1 Tax=Crotalaria pallida TaxID=3830 RepID=A0AAN9J579_CROPI